jgi:hypothetical protein
MKIKSLFAALYIALATIAPLAICVPAVAITGCATSKTTIAYKSIASLQEAAEVALDSWLRYVYHERVRIGAITDSNQRSDELMSLSKREEKVQAALDAYKAADLVTKVAIDSARLKKEDPPPLDLLATGRAFINSAKSK